jgi:hypothetical protein
MRATEFVGVCAMARLASEASSTAAAPCDDVASAGMANSDSARLSASTTRSATSCTDITAVCSAA